MLLQKRRHIQANHWSERYAFGRSRSRSSYHNLSRQVGSRVVSMAWRSAISLTHPGPSYSTTR